MHYTLGNIQYQLLKRSDQNIITQNFVTFTSQMAHWLAECSHSQKGVRFILTVVMNALHCALANMLALFVFRELSYIYSHALSVNIIVILYHHQ